MRFRETPLCVNSSEVVTGEEHLSTWAPVGSEDAGLGNVTFDNGRDVRRLDALDGLDIGGSRRGWFNSCIGCQ